MNKPKIVILDAKPLINDGLSRERLEELGERSCYNQSSEEQIIPRAQEAELILVNKVNLPEETYPLLGRTNCVINPHIAWASLAARKRLLNTVCENIIHFLNRQPINVIQA